MSDESETPEGSRNAGGGTATEADESGVHSDDSTAHADTCGGNKYESNNGENISKDQVNDSGAHTDDDGDHGDGDNDDDDHDDDDHDDHGDDDHDHDDNDDDHGDHGLPPEDLQYPEFTFDAGEVGDDGSFDLHADLDREELREWVEDLAGGLASHDVAVESPDGYVTLGVAPEGTQMRFDPDESGVGDFEVTFEMRAKAMFVADDPDGEKVGARGGKGFVPIEALTEGDSEEFRCYNWLDEPTDP